MYPAYQLGWFPDYSDADNYLTPFFLTENFLGNHYDNPEVNDLILEQAVTHRPGSPRRRSSSEIQDKVAADLSTIPYLQGAQVAVVGTDVEGAEDTLDASFKFRYGRSRRAELTALESFKLDDGGDLLPAGRPRSPVPLRNP